MVWYSELFKNFPQFAVIDTVKGFKVVNEAKVDVLLEFCCFFYDPINISNLISGSSFFSKSILNIWKFSVHRLLKPRLENFEHSSIMQIKLKNSTVYHGCSSITLSVLVKYVGGV